MKSRIFLFLAGLVLVGLTVSAFFTVDATEYVYVTRFGAHTATYDGATEAVLQRSFRHGVQRRLDRGGVVATGRTDHHRHRLFRRALVRP